MENDKVEIIFVLVNEVKCVPVSSCPQEDIYGTDPSHFVKYGFISPSQRKCFTSSGNSRKHNGILIKWFDSPNIIFRI